MAPPDGRDCQHDEVAGEASRECDRGERPRPPTARSGSQARWKRFALELRRPATRQLRPDGPHLPINLGALESCTRNDFPTRRTRRSPRSGVCLWRVPEAFSRQGLHRVRMSASENNSELRNDTPATCGGRPCESGRPKMVTELETTKRSGRQSCASPRVLVGGFATLCAEWRAEALSNSCRQKSTLQTMLCN